MHKPRSGRQVYNKQALSKASQSKRAKKYPQRPQKKPLSHIKTITEKSKEEEEESIKEEEKLEVINDKPEKENKKEKTVKPRLKLDEKHLLYSENGIKKYYEAIMSTTFKESSSNERNLAKLVDLFKNWHFILFPRYDTDLFTSRLTALGKKSSVKSYMSRLRKIHKGEETWEVMYDEQNEILDRGKSIRDQALKKDDEDNAKEPNSNYMKKPPLAIQLKPNTIEEKAFEDIILDNIAELNKNDLDDVNSKDFDNMDHNDREEDQEVNSKDFDNFSMSDVSLKPKKRSYAEAFGETIEVENLIETKKPKLSD